MQNRKEEYEGFIRMINSQDISDVRMAIDMIENFGFRHCTKDDAKKLCNVFVNRAIPFLKICKIEPSLDYKIISANAKKRDEFIKRMEDIVTKLQNKYSISIVQLIDYNQINLLIEALSKDSKRINYF